MTMLGEAAVAYQVVLTKVDQLRAGELPDLLATLGAELARKPGAHPELIATSARSGAGIERLRAALAALAAQPAEAPGMTEPAPPSDRGDADRGAALHAALRRRDLRRQVRRPRDGRGRARRGLRARHRAAQAGRHQPGRGARRRPADQGDARPPEDQERVRRGAAGDRFGDRRDRRDGARRQHQQADRGRDPRRRRAARSACRARTRS